MDHLRELLTRIRKSLDGDTVFKETVNSCFKNLLGFEVNPKDISIQGDVLRIKTSPAKRNEIKLHEEELLKSIREQTKLSLKKLLY